MTVKLNIEQIRKILKTPGLPKDHYAYADGYIQAWEEQEKKIQEQGKTIRGLVKALEHIAWGSSKGNPERKMAQDALSTVPEEYRG